MPTSPSPIAGALRRADRLADHGITWSEEPMPTDDLAGHARLAASAVPIAVGESRYAPGQSARRLARRCLFHRAGRCRPRRRHCPLADGGASGRGDEHRGLPTFPDGPPCQPCLRHPEFGDAGIDPATGGDHDLGDDHRRRSGLSPTEPGLGIDWDWDWDWGRIRQGAVCTGPSRHLPHFRAVPTTGSDSAGPSPHHPDARSSPCSRSASRSAGSSSPTDMRTRPAVMPSAAF